MGDGAGISGCAMSCSPMDSSCSTILKNQKMEMDGATAMVGIVVLALCALPFVLDHRRRSKKAAQLLRTLRELAKQHQCKVDHHDQCGDAVLGLDKDRNALVFHAQRQDVVTSHFVDLAEVRACQAIKAKRSTKGGGTDAMLDRVELCLLPKDTTKSETHLVLYQAAHGVLVNGEIQFADKWAQLINDRLKNK
jgi:hypothetical protein